jgi:hypothetical protein
MGQRKAIIAMVRAAAFSATVATATLGGAHDRELEESSDFRVRVQAALRLGRTGAPARPDLEGGLKDSHPAVRVACAVALGTLGDPAALSAIERAQRGESFASVKTAMQEAIDKLKGASAAKAASTGSGPDGATLDRAKYVVQLGSMRNATNVRAADLDGLMRQAAKSKASSIKGAVVLDGNDESALKKANEKRIPVLLLDGSLTRLTQSTARDGGVVVSAQFSLSIRKVPQQTLKATVSGNASASDDARAAGRGLAELQNRAVNGAVESAISSVGAEIAALTR